MLDALMETPHVGADDGAQNEAKVHREVPGQYSAATSGVDNFSFLRAVFGDDLGEALPVVVSFKGDPNKVAKSAWFGQPWHDDEAGASDSNSYFSLATFTPNDKGGYRRQKAQFAALYCVVLDDIGTKVPLEERALPDAAWWLETSPGNFQVGYLLDAPLADAALADQLLKAIIAAGLCDPGAGGPCARLVRLPVGVNGKHSPAFTCRLTGVATRTPLQRAGTG